jgi:hypothetical protein
MIRGELRYRATSSVKKPLGLPASAGHMEISSKSNCGLWRGQMFQKADGESMNSGFQLQGDTEGGGGGGRHLGQKERIEERVFCC